MASCEKMCFILLTILVIFEVTVAENIPGVVQLNSGSFDKVIEKFPVALVKFDKPYSSGDIQKTFKEMVPDTIGQKNLLIATIPVKDYGDKENSDLAERFSVKKEDFPKYKLFIQGKSDPIDYTGDVKNADAIKRFLAKESGLWIGLPACIEEFDNLVKEFWKVDSRGRADIIARAQEEAETINHDLKKERATMYIKTMQKIMETGDDFVEKEIARVDKLSSGQISDKKKQQLKDRSNILTSFQVSKSEASKKKEEL